MLRHQSHQLLLPASARTIATWVRRNEGRKEGRKEEMREGAIKHIGLYSSCCFQAEKKLILMLYVMPWGKAKEISNLIKNKYMYIVVGTTVPKAFVLSTT
jgi:hypothetical protein